MIKRDSYGFVLDNTGDGGDSANRAGLMALCGSPEPLYMYGEKIGTFVRHPIQVPWNNPNNFSRDQLIPYTAGLWKQGFHKTAEAALWSHIKRLGFCQNSERDAVGTTKYPWKHSFINDKGIPETRAFDFADPLMPDSLWHLILCAKAWYFYWLAPIGVCWFLLSLAFYCRFNKDDDEGQIIAQCAVLGGWAKALYRQWRPDWKDKLTQYWGIRRNQIEIAKMLIELVEDCP